MSKRVYADENGTPRNLVEVPMPMNNKPRQSNQQFPFDNNNIIPYNNNNINNSYRNNLPQDEYAMVPRVGSKKKTIIIKDEKGNEISRIVSSNNKDRPPMMDNMGRNNYITPMQQIQPYPTLQQQPPQQFNQIQPYQPVQPQQNGLVLQPQQYLLQPASANAMTPVPLIVQSMNTPNPFNENQMRGPIMTQTIPEESSLHSARRSKRHTSAQYRTLEKARDLKTAKEREREFKDLRKKLEDDTSLMSDDRMSPVQRLKMVDKRDHIFCCAFCERANTDTCQFCWRLCGFPTWFATLIGAIFLLIIIALAVVLGLYAAKIIT